MPSNLSQFDLKVVYCLQSNARLLTTHIASKVSCRNSVVVENCIRKLEDNHYILGYTPVLNLPKFDKKVTAYTHVVLSEKSAENLSLFIEKVIELREVVRCSQVSGEIDYVMEVVIDDMEEYNSLIMEKMSEIGFVKRFYTQVILDEVKKNHVIDLSNLYRKSKPGRV